MFTVKKLGDIFAKKNFDDQIIINLKVLELSRLLTFYFYQQMYTYFPK